MLDRQQVYRDRVCGDLVIPTDGVAVVMSACLTRAWLETGDTVRRRALSPVGTVERERVLSYHARHAAAMSAVICRQVGDVWTRGD